jgi:hypothetical protein
MSNTLKSWLTDLTKPATLATFIVVIGSVFVLFYRVSQIELRANEAAQFRKEMFAQLSSVDKTMAEKQIKDEMMLVGLEKDLSYVRLRIDEIYKLLKP